MLGAEESSTLKATQIGLEYLFYPRSPLKLFQDLGLTISSRERNEKEALFQKAERGKYLQTKKLVCPDPATTILEKSLRKYPTSSTPRRSGFRDLVNNLKNFKAMEGTLTEMLMVDVDAQVSFKSLDLSIGTLTDAPGLPTYSGVVKSIFSPRTGRYALIVDEFAVHLVDTHTRKEKLQLLEPNISQIIFSPLENFFVTATKFNA